MHSYHHVANPHTPTRHSSHCSFLFLQGTIKCEACHYVSCQLSSAWCNLFSTNVRKQHCWDLSSIVSFNGDNVVRDWCRQFREGCMMRREKDNNQLWLVKLFKKLKKPCVINTVSWLLNFSDEYKFWSQFFMESLQTQLCSLWLGFHTICAK